MAVIVVGGNIGLGKSTVSKLLGNHFQSEVFFEKVDDNPILPLFYEEPEVEQQRKRYPFLLQLTFLNSRFELIKEALVHENNIMDRSIYEDWYFAKVNTDLGRISDIEFRIYEDLLHNMMEELDELPKKSPDLMVYLSGSFETMMDRIRLRSRKFEQDQDLIDYYYALWEGYDDWVDNHYNASHVIKFNMDELDIVKRPEDALWMCEEVEKKLLILR